MARKRRLMPSGPEPPTKNVAVQLRCLGCGTIFDRTMALPVNTTEPPTLSTPFTCSSCNKRRTDGPQAD